MSAFALTLALLVSAHATVDCDDAAVELCGDGIDNDCDGMVDVGSATFTTAAGELQDWTSSLTGTSTAAAEVTVDEAGVLDICGGTWFTHIRVTADDVHIRGAANHGTALHGAGSGTVVYANGVGDLELSNLTVTGGEASWGAGLELRSSTATLRGLQVLGNHAGVGGAGAYIYASNVAIEDSLIANNHADVFGGGLAFARGSTGVMDRTILVANQAPKGAAAFVHDTDLTAVEVDVVDNHATEGGGFYLTRQSTLAFEGDFIANSPQDVWSADAGSAFQWAQNARFFCDANDCAADVDGDGDGVVASADCDDADPTAYPGAIERCGDERDNDCDGSIDNAGATLLTDSGSLLDLTGALAAGTSTAPAQITLDQPGVLSVCEGTWYTHLTVDADVDVLGAGATASVLHGAHSGSVIRAVGVRFGLEDIRITAGSSLLGGGVDLVHGTDATLVRVDLTDNTARMHGGGLHVSSSSAEIIDCTIHDNQARFGGGLLVAGSAEVHVSGTAIHDNAANSSGGGALAMSSATLDLVDTTLEHNQAAAGGGVHLAPNTSLTMADGSLSHNQAEFYGGAMDVDNAHATFTGTMLTGNTAGHNGGGVYVSRGGHVLLDSADVARNEAAMGPAIFVHFSSATLDQTSVHDHSITAIKLWGLGDSSLNGTGSFWGQPADVSYSASISDTTNVAYNDVLGMHATFSYFAD